MQYPLLFATSLDSDNGSAGSKITIVDSGPISSKIPTGTAITLTQSAALRVNIPERGYSFSSASIILDCSLCSTNTSTITLSLCSSLEEEKSCLEKGTFSLVQTKRKINATWISKTLPLITNDFYWLKVEGNAPSFQESFSWLDAGQRFTATEAFTNENGSWTVLKDVVGASTLVFVVE